ncbi:MAG: MFS transporter [Burkholderiales bacterium]|nr:MFS transporter [Burkholderiales bacterium]
MQTSPRPAAEAAPAGLSPALVATMAVACGLIAANLYYAQPVIRLIAPGLGLAPAAASLIVTLTQLGFCVGLVFLVPLGDVLENRRLVVGTLAGAAMALALAASARTATPFLAACALVGLGSVAVQMLVPIAAHFTPEARRGRVVGQVMSGLLAGIMLARPVASLVAGHLGWRALFAASALLMLALAALLWRRLPLRRPARAAGGPGYGALIASLWTVLRTQPLLRRRAAYQAAMFGAFSLYWTATPLLLASPRFGLGPGGLAWFSLAGAAGALAAPVAGRLADQGHTRVATGAALSLAVAAFVLAGLAGAGAGSLGLLLVAGIGLDLAVQANMVLGQRAIYSLGAAVRNRLNALYMVLFFFGGAFGSAIASSLYLHGGWAAVAAAGAAFPAVALLWFATDRTGRALGEAAPALGSAADGR